MKNAPYQPEIDGIRAIAVFAVVFYHLKISFINGGFVGVDIFFVISGYLITNIIKSEVERKKFSYRIFFIKRFKRLLPALVFVSLVSFIFAFFILSPSDYSNFSKSILSSILFTSNIFFWTQSNYFDQISEFKPFLHTWSLGIEMTFYLVWPLLLLLLVKYSNKFFSLIIIITTIIFSIILIEFIFSKGLILETQFFYNFLYGKYTADTIFYLAPFRFFEFLFGAVLVFLDKKDFSKSTSLLFFILGFFLIIASIFFLNANTKFPGIYALPALLGTGLLIYFKDKSFLKILLNNKIMIFFGLISYSLYLVHWPIISIFRYYNLGTLSFINKIIILLISILSSFIIYKFIEKPWRKKYDLKKKIISFFSIFTIISLCFFTFQNNGFIFRLDIKQQKLYNHLNDKSFSQICTLEKSIFKKVKELICKTGKEKESNIILLGDSNGTMWFQPFAELASKNNLILTNYSRICSNFPHQKSEDQFLKCSEINTDADTLIIGSQWFDYQNSLISKKVAKKFISNINLINKNLNFKNIKKIIIMGQIPSIMNNNLDIKSCLLRAKYLKKQLSCTNYYETSYLQYKFLDSIRELNLLMRKEIQSNLSKNYKVLYIDPVKNLCTKNSCLQADENYNLYFSDNNHISNFGAKFVINKNLEILENFIRIN
jgi:peptidoglycan/LPS O-acetylase OafA/YrhL